MEITRNVLDAPGHPSRLMGPKPGPVLSMVLSQFPKSKLSTGIPKGLERERFLKKMTFLLSQTHIEE